MQIFARQFSNDFPGLRGVNLFAHQYPIEPILVFTEFYMDKPVFGPHAHAGISVMTYMLPDSPGSFLNRDSHGDFSTIEPGGLHITQAGSGIHHDEFPKQKGMTHGFQIWINHAEKNRMVAPKSFHAFAAEVPELITDNYTVRVLHGEYNGIKTPWQMVTDVCLLHVFVKPNQHVSFSNREMAFAYLLQGDGTAKDGQAIRPQNLLTFSAEEPEIQFQASSQGLEFMFATAIPLKEQITYGGPFVATTAEQMQQMKQRYARGEMGALEPYEQH